MAREHHLPVGILGRKVKELWRVLSLAMDQACLRNQQAQAMKLIVTPESARCLQAARTSCVHAACQSNPNRHHMGAQKTPEGVSARNGGPAGK